MDAFGGFLSTQESEGLLDNLFYDQRRNTKAVVRPYTAAQAVPAVPLPPPPVDLLGLSQAFKKQGAASNNASQMFHKPVQDVEMPQPSCSQLPKKQLSYKASAGNILDCLLPLKNMSDNNRNSQDSIKSQVSQKSIKEKHVTFSQPTRVVRPTFKAPYRSTKNVKVHFSQQPVRYTESLHSSQQTSGEDADVVTNEESVQSRYQNSYSNGSPLPQQPSQEDLFQSQTPASQYTPAVADTIDTPYPLTIPELTPGGSREGITKLRPVSEIPSQYRGIFNFPYFNIVQSKVFDDILYSDKSVVVCAPTGAGKTVIFELAILRLLIKSRNEMGVHVKVVYMAPLKALCSERYEDWNERFGPLGLKCKELTGDTELDDYFELQEVNIIMTTPEKWDSLTRRWRDNKSLVHLVKLFLVDEIHLLNDESRGATIEAVLSRMKTIQSALAWDTDNPQRDPPGIRFVAVSATIPNIGDVAEWLGTDQSPAVSYRMSDEHRPVKLRKVVLGFPCSESQSEFRFDFSLNYKLASVIQTYSDQKPTLVFCATRKSVQQAASTLVGDAKFIMNSQHKQRLQKEANMLRDSKLRDLILSGVGYHHAGMEMSDRKSIESLFLSGDLPVLMATSTLAMGVNLPAHLVVIKSTQHYCMGMYQEYGETQILQMIGRAGRPQFDTSATAVILTRNSTKGKYDALLNGTQLIESSLHKHLIEHLNAEVVLNTITDVTVALEWIKSTFLYIRIMKNPRHYGVPAGLSTEHVEQRLQDMCLKNLNALGKLDLVSMDEDHFVMKPTDTGRLMARYSIAFETMKQFSEITSTQSISELLTLISGCQELSDIQLRVNEKKTLNTLNNDKHRLTIRYPMEGKIKTREMKINCLVQAQLGCLTVQDFGLSQDITKIFRAGQRIAKCLVEFLWHKNNFKSLLNALLLSKCFKAKLWENSRYVSRQLEGIGPTLSNALVNAGMPSFQKVEETNPRELEMIVNRHPPFGNNLREAVKGLPKYEVAIEQLGNYSDNKADISVMIVLANQNDLNEKATAGLSHTCVLLIGDEDNKVVHKSRITDAMLVKTGSWSKKIEVKRAGKEELSVNLISSEWVGLDVQSTYVPFYTGRKKWKNANVEETNKKGLFERKKSSPDNTSSDYDVYPDSGESKRNLYQDDNQNGQNEDVIFPERKPCSHRCINKTLCAHECCKFGIVVKRPSKNKSNNPDTLPKPKSGRQDTMDFYRNSLQKRIMQMPDTPSVKRLKLPHSSVPAPDLSKFAYTPQQREKYCYTPQQSDLPGSSKPLMTATPRGWDELDFYHQQRNSVMDNLSEEGSEYLNPNSCKYEGESHGQCNSQMAGFRDSEEGYGSFKMDLGDISDDSPMSCMSSSLDDLGEDELPDLACPRIRTGARVSGLRRQSWDARRDAKPPLEWKVNKNKAYQFGHHASSCSSDGLSSSSTHNLGESTNGKVFAWNLQGNKEKNVYPNLKLPLAERVNSMDCEVNAGYDFHNSGRFKNAPLSNDFMSAKTKLLMMHNQAKPIDSKHLRPNPTCNTPSPAFSSEDESLLVNHMESEEYKWSQQENYPHKIWAVSCKTTPPVTLSPSSPIIALQAPVVNSTQSTYHTEKVNTSIEDASEDARRKYFSRIFEGIF